MKSGILQLRLLKEGLFFAMHAIVVNKLRTLLTLLGLTIGIFAIISVFTVLDWMEKAIRDSISSLGDNVVYVDKWPWMPTPDFKWWEVLRWPVPNLDEYEEIKNRATRVDAVAFSLFASRNIQYRNNMAENVLLWIVTHDFDRIRSFEIEQGRYFSAFESQSGKNRAILGHELATRLFENEDPLGKEVDISGRKVLVIGIAKKEGTGGISDEGLDNVVLLPVNYVRNLVYIRSESLNPSIMVRAKPGVSNEEMSEEIRSIMRSTRRLKPAAGDNFSLNRASAITQGFNAIFAMINLGGAIIGGFSILVGGFGIANIMFVSVKERTNIIGIQKALGAKRRFILGQFLYESVILSLIGGALGLLIIFLGTLLINKLWDWNISLTFGNILVGLGISGVVGIFSGYAPARTAARLDPVKAITSTF